MLIMLKCLPAAREQESRDIANARRCSKRDIVLSLTSTIIYWRSRWLGSLKGCSIFEMRMKKTIQELESWSLEGEHTRVTIGPRSRWRSRVTGITQWNSCWRSEYWDMKRLTYSNLCQDFFSILSRPKIINKDDVVHPKYLRWKQPRRTPTLSRLWESSIL